MSRIEFNHLLASVSAPSPDQMRELCAELHSRLATTAAVGPLALARFSCKLLIVPVVAVSGPPLFVIFWLDEVEMLPWNVQRARRLVWCFFAMLS